MEAQHLEEQKYELHPKKDAVYNPKNRVDNEDSQKTQDYQPQWKMGIPTRDPYSAQNNVNNFYT